MIFSLGNTTTILFKQSDVKRYVFFNGTMFFFRRS